MFSVRPNSPWFNSELVKEKRKRRKLERTYKRTSLAIDKERHNQQRNINNSLLSIAKTTYYKTKVESATSTKELYQVCNKLLNRERASILPSHECANELADRFVNYFFFHLILGYTYKCFKRTAHEYRIDITQKS